MGFTVFDGSIASPGEYIGCLDPGQGSKENIEAWARDGSVQTWNDMGFQFNMCVAACMRNPAMHVNIYRILHHGRVYVRAAVQ